MKLNSPEKLQSLTFAEMEAVLAAVDAHWASKAQYGFSVTNPRLLTPLFFMLVTAICYGLIVDESAAPAYFRSAMIFCELGFFAMFCLVAGQLAWNHLSRSTLIKRARDIGVDVATLEEDALELWVARPLRQKQRASASLDLRKPD